eukprot:5491181-Pleurochrysis_carterae.AAC.1
MSEGGKRGRERERARERTSFPLRSRQPRARRPHACVTVGLQEGESASRWAWHTSNWLAWAVKRNVNMDKSEKLDEAPSMKARAVCMC